MKRQGTLLPSWSPAKDALLVRLWNGGMHSVELGERFGVSPHALTARLVKLREQGHQVERRHRGRRTNTPLIVAPRGRIVFAEADGEDGLTRPTTPGHQIAPAIVYDRDGRAVALLDPVTRERRPIGVKA